MVAIYFSNHILYSFIAVFILVLVSVGVYAVTNVVDSEGYGFEVKNMGTYTGLKPLNNGAFSIEGNIYPRIDNLYFLGTSGSNGTGPRWKEVHGYKIYAVSSVSTPQLCIGSDCRTSWPSGGSTTTTTNDINGVMKITGTKSGNANNDAAILFYDSGNTRTGWVGDGSSVDSGVYLYSDTGSVVLQSNRGFIDVRPKDTAYSLVVRQGDTNSGDYLSIRVKDGYTIFDHNEGKDVSIDALGNLVVAGSVSAGDFLYTSDERLKENIVPLTNSLEKVQQLQGVSFNWKENGEENIGLIAQNVESVFPELVVTNSDGMKSVKYGNVVAILIEAVKEQEKKIDLQNKRIAELEEEIERLR